AAARVQPFVAGSNTLASRMPVLASAWPPTTSTRPSGSITWPAQNKPDVELGTAVNSWVVGFQRRADEVFQASQASHTSTSPVYRSVACTATSGQFIAADHCPWPA